MELIFSNKIRAEYTGEVEKLFFFNKDQYRYYDQIFDSIDRFGNLKIVNENDFIRVVIDGCKGCENLFLSNGPKLFGIVVYFRENEETLNMLHLALDLDYLESVGKDSVSIFFAVVDKLKSIAKNFPGIKYLALPYGNKIQKIQI